eukprot:TCONS_00039997-protein
MNLNIPCLPWMDRNDHMLVCKHVEYSCDYNEKYKNHPYMQNFASDNMVKFLYGSNSQEGTLPKNRDGDTYTMVRYCFENHTNFNMTGGDKWNSDGQYSNQEKNQIFRHFNAKQSLAGEKRLTIDNIKRAHFILMENSVDEHKNPISNGEFRTTSSYSMGSWIAYPPYQCIERGLKKIIYSFNFQISEGSFKDKLNAVTDLFYDFVALHPFQDGNGRMARILLSFGLEQIGTPFPVVLSTGHSRSRGQIIKALKMKDVHSHHNGLFGIVASSLALQWQQFFNYIKFCD